MKQNQSTANTEGSMTKMDGRNIDHDEARELMTDHCLNMVRIMKRYTESGGRLFCWNCGVDKGPIIAIKPAPILCAICLQKFAGALVDALEVVRKDTAERQQRAYGDAQWD